ncbi:MAG: sigma-70 family RNA polymerase sigma factor [Gemmataceae bacterium]
MPFLSLSHLTPQPIEWLWPGHLPLGHISLLDGDPGVGKSILTLDIAARVTTGREFPGCRRTPCAVAEPTPCAAPANVLILNAEDSARELIHPRLAAARADLDRVTVWQHHPGEAWLRLPGDLAQLDNALTRHRPRLLILDPFTAFLGPGLNLASEHDARSALAPLADLAAKHNCAVQLIRHLNKSGGQNALYRGLHSIGIVAAARLAWLVGRDPRLPGRLILAEEKSNLATPQPSLAFTIINRARHAPSPPPIVGEGPGAPGFPSSNGKAPSPGKPTTSSAPAAATASASAPTSSSPPSSNPAPALPTRSPAPPANTASPTAPSAAPAATSKSPPNSSATSTTTATGGSSPASNSPTPSSPPKQKPSTKPSAKSRKAGKARWTNPPLERVPSATFSRKTPFPSCNSAKKGEKLVLVKMETPMHPDNPDYGAELEGYRPYLHAIARMHLDYRLRKRIDPEDVVQYVFCKAIEKWDQCSGSRKAWLRRILLNHLKDLVDKMRAKKANVDLEVALEHSSVRLDALLAAEQSSPSQRAMANEELARLEEALAKLPLKQQEVVILNRYHQVKLEDIAVQLGMTLGTVGGLLRRGLEGLVRHLTFPE